MHIGILSPVVGFQGGIERLSFELARGLRARGHRVFLLPGGRPGREAQRFAAAFDRWSFGDPLDVVLAQKLLDPGALGPFGATPVLLAAHDHDHTCPRSHRYLPVTHEPCHRPPGASCVLHGCIVVRRREHRVPLTLINPYALRARLLELAGRGSFLACSDYVARRLRDAGVDARQIQVAHPSPADTPAPLVPAPDGQRLLVAGQLLRGKGVDLAIEALAWLPDATLRVVGDGPSRGQLEELATRVAPGRVRFEGFVAAEEMARCYDEASLVLVPSRWPEPFGMTGIEAMRRGRPVVGADHGGIPEWLPEGVAGFRFSPGDPRSLAAAVQRASSVPDLGERAFAFVQQRFSHERYLVQIEAALLRSAGQGHDLSSRSAPREPPCSGSFCAREA